MPTVEESRCPSCGEPGTLSLGSALVAKPIGTFSLAGAGMKVSAVLRPTLSCSACGLHRTGLLDPDGKHVWFPTEDGPDDAPDQPQDAAATQGEPPNG